MALANPEQVTPPSMGAASAIIYPLGTVTANGNTDHGDVTGFVSRIYIYVNNGATNSVVYVPQGSHDGTNWFNVGWRVSTGTYATTNSTTTAGTKEAIYLAGTDIPRYIRVNVSTANANGTAFTLMAER